MLDGFESTDFLAHIDAPLNPTQRDIILAQIRSELPPNRHAQLHPRVRASYEPKFSQAMEIEHARLAKGEEKVVGSGVDLSRYESLEAPDQASQSEGADLTAQWRDTLQKAYTSSTYLSGRNTNLSLLETYGKNAWLIGNSQLEDTLKDLERELLTAKRELEDVEEERRIRQDGVRAEMMTLEDTWKKGVRGIIEVEIATSDLRNEALSRRRAAANGQ